MLLRRIVVPISRPVLAVLSLFTVIGSWKDFRWPLVALTDRGKQQPLLVFAFFQRRVVRRCRRIHRFHGLTGRPS
jgi:multiple sugar transport system permease protein